MNKMLLRYCLFIVVTLLVANDLSAQSISDTVKINEISIYDNQSRIAEVNVIEIDSMTKENFSSCSLAELLSNNSFVNIRDYGEGSFASASIRGAGASHTQVRWKGININSPLSGQVDLSLIPIGFIDQLIIKPGGNSIVDQSGGLGGSIVLSNIANSEKGFHLKLSQEFASFESINSFARIEYGTKKWHFRSRLMTAKAKNNFTFQNTALLPNEICTLSRANTKQLSQLHEISYRASEQDIISFSIWQNSMLRNIPALMSYEGAGHFEKQNNNSIRSVLNWQKFTKNGSLNIQTAYAYENLEYYLEHATTGGNILIANSESYTNSYLNQIKYNYKKENKFSFEIQLDFNKHIVHVNDNKSNSSFSQKRNELNLFTGLRKQLSNGLSAFIFVRNSLSNKILNPVSPSLGFEYSPKKNHPVMLRASITRNFRLPSLNDLYYIPGGNPELKPEKGLSEEISLNYKTVFGNIKTLSKISFYSSRINDWILWHPTQFGYWTPENIQSVLSQGLEISNAIEGTLSLINYRLLLQYSHNQTTKESAGDLYKSEQLIYEPKNIFHLSANFIRGKYSFNINSSFTGKRYSSYGDDREYNALDSYWIHNLRLGRRMEYHTVNAEIIFQVNNIFNKNYQNIRLRAMPGRNYSINFKVTF